jgi:hypothetical protein
VAVAGQVDAGLGPKGVLDGGAGASATADRGTRTPSPELVDVVSISEHGAMRSSTIEHVERLADSLGVAAARVRSFQYGLAAVRRGALVVQQASGSTGRWQFPMAVSAFPLNVVAPVFGADVASVLGSGAIVMGTTTAALRGARAGDEVELISSSGRPTRFIIGMVAPDTVVGGAELVITEGQADLLGVTTVTRVLLHGPFDRASILSSIRSSGFVDNANVRVAPSWGLPNPDGTLGFARTKVLLGEFDFRIVNSQSVSLDPAWVAASLPSNRELFDSIAVRARCHRVVHPHLQAALAEVAASGLSSAIDLRNTNTYGGCWNPRYSRVSAVVGSLSRHAWGMAFDMNTVANAQGREPPGMDCRVVRIFRKHGFAWGGNFLTADGMHFEFVGERRDLWPYPSEYCPNPPAEVGASAQAAWPSARDTMFATVDGVADSGGH